jgi:2-keto-4-pentenoate hydratase/2-oxohepta-3-ene-1,7-dioic acid hydratase in catechol pathway
MNHVQEFDKQIPEQPLFFLKPDSAILQNNRPFFYPEFSNEIHYEVELVVKINRLGKYIQEKFAHRYYEDLGLGIDFTARDLQRHCIETGQPWSVAKCFDQSAVISPFVSKKQFPDLHDITFSLYQNGKKVQEGNSGDMLFGIDRLISYLSQFMTLKTGDLIFTGTPSGVGTINLEDRLQGFMEDTKMFDFKIK